MSFTDNYLAQIGNEKKYGEAFGSAILLLLEALDIGASSNVGAGAKPEDSINLFASFQNKLQIYREKFPQAARALDAIDHEVNYLMNVRLQFFKELQALGKGHAGGMFSFSQTQYNINYLVNDMNSVYNIFNQILQRVNANTAKILSSNSLDAQQKQSIYYLTSNFKKTFNIGGLRKLIDQVNSIAAYQQNQNQSNQSNQPLQKVQPNINNQMTQQKTNVMDMNSHLQPVSPQV